MTDLLQQLQALEAELHDPRVRRSEERLEQLLHPDFHEVGRSGRRYTREEAIGALVEQADSPLASACDYAVTRLGEGCALLTYRSAHEGASGAVMQMTNRSSIWLLSGKRWQLIYHQGTAVPPTA